MLLTKGAAPAEVLLPLTCPAPPSPRPPCRLTPEDKEAAAEVYLRLVRQLEGTRTDTLQGLAKLLRVQRLSLTGGGGQNPAKLKLADTVRHPTRPPLQPPAFSLQPPAFSLQPPAFSFQPSAFSLLAS